MAIVTVSSKFQIAIPRSIREKIGLKPKEKLVMIEKGGIITLIPQLPIKEMKENFEKPTHPSNLTKLTSKSKIFLTKT
ncbi:MAG: AbrB/MazE/SpoVT family DNA-binding domain-containing protein, partial [Candidatus Syntrophoarchaeum sp.]|nr:AbrB/MazE/SpoVT family DNA-binding domain-containing protein [Candidatus Syntrophoarchaeum sp.]